MKMDYSNPATPLVAEQSEPKEIVSKAVRKRLAVQRRKQEEMKKIEYTEGICGDGAAILKNGQPITITEILNTLNIANKAIEERDRLMEALIEARKDINWMLNERRFLNGFVFNYIDKALSGIKEQEK